MSLAGGPNTVFWEVTNRCNLSCETCYNSRFLNDKRHTLTLEDGEKRCRDIIANGISSVIFLGGEPLADRNLFHYLEILRGAGIDCSISTNGTLVTQSVAERFAGLNLKLVAVSLDGGTAETNDRIRGRGSFERIIRGIRALPRPPGRAAA
jgi:MoaA/NifB/PqqE/SkfB family radical SAM enzyme